MRKTLALLLSSLSFAAYAADAPAPAKPPTPAAPVVIPAWSLVKEKSSIKFYAIENGAPIEGRFTDFSTDIHFDHDHLDKSSINAEVNTGSVASDNGDAESNLKLPEWLSVAAFPKAVFKSTKITRMPQSENYYVEGDLTLRGKTEPVVLNFQLKNYGDTDIGEGYITVKRIAFGVGQGQWAKDDVIKDDVRVELRIVEEKK